MKKKSPSENDSARLAVKPKGDGDAVDLSDADGGATLRAAPKFERKAKDEPASRKVSPAPLPAAPVDIAAVKTVIGAEVPAEIRDRAQSKRLEKSHEKGSEKGHEKSPEKALQQDQATVLNAPAFVADKAGKALAAQETMIKVSVSDLVASPDSRPGVEADEASLEGADGAPTTPLVIEPAAITAPVKATTTAPVLPAAPPPGKPTAIVEAVKLPMPLTAQQRATRARLIVAGIAVALVIALFIPGILKARTPSIEALQEAYKSTFRDPHLANPRADMIKFELVKSAPCATHPEDSCLVYDLTGPKYSSQFAVFKGADGWVLERHGIEK